ncbi:MAG: PIN-like domain-containing protein [Solirubrobacteraceae bacterium]
MSAAGATEAGTPAAAGAGLYDGFEGYRTATTANYVDLFRDGLVVPDANVLLNLYRFTSQARDDLLNVLERLGDRLWVPHQVLAEFWRNRENVLRDPRDTEKTAQDLLKAKEQATSIFRAWANRVSLPIDEASKLAGALGSGFDEAINGVDRFSDETAIESARDTDRDVVLTRLDSILSGRVGEPLDDEQYAAAVQEGLRRVAAREPPGYLDKNKEDEAAAGDFLVWEQILIEVARAPRDLLFVTGDVKEDWWRREAGEQRGPRLELVAEMRDRCGSRLFMLRPATLLSLARDHLDVDVQEESVDSTDRVERLLEDRLEDGGWHASALDALLDRLKREAPVQAEVLAYASVNGGVIGREKVYDIGEYDEDRSLRSFTRPIKRIAQEFRDDDAIDALAVDVLEADYDSLAENPSLATGFSVNPEVLPLLVEAVERSRRPAV